MVAPPQGPSEKQLALLAPDSLLPPHHPMVPIVGLAPAEGKKVIVEKTATKNTNMIRFIVVPFCCLVLYRYE
jgi:hypothetical protein